MAPLEEQSANEAQDLSAEIVQQTGEKSQAEAEAPTSPSAAGITIGWEIMSRRGVWVLDSRDAKKLRTLKDERPADRVGAQKDRKPIGTMIGGAAFLLLTLILGHECFQALQYRDRIQAGMQALAAGQADLARLQFGLAISSAPRASDAYYYRGLAEMQRGSNGNALEDYQRAVELDPKNLKAYLARAAMRTKTHHYEQAVQDCTTVIKADPNYGEAYRLRAAAYNHLGEYDLAIADSEIFLNQHQTLDSDRGDAYAKRAFALDQKHEYNRALEDYTNAIACDQGNGTHYASRAIVYMHLRKWKKALGDCDVAMTLREPDPSVYKVRGICNAALKMQRNSLADLDHLVRLHPTVDTHRLRGNERYIAHDYLGTLEDFDFVLEAEPDDKGTNLKYQKAKIALQRRAQRSSIIADAQPSQTAAEEPTDLNKPVPVLVSTGYRLIVKGEPDEAIKYLTVAVKNAPNDTSARRYLAFACMQSGMTNNAISQFQALSEMNALMPGDKLLFADSLVLGKQPEKAIELYHQLLAADPNNDRARTNLIKTFLSNGAAGEAAELAAAGMRLPGSQAGKYKELYEQAMTSKSAASKTL